MTGRVAHDRLGAGDIVKTERRPSAPTENFASPSEQFVRRKKSRPRVGRVATSSVWPETSIIPDTPLTLRVSASPRSSLIRELFLYLRRRESGRRLVLPRRTGRNRPPGCRNTAGGEGAGGPGREGRRGPPAAADLRRPWIGSTRSGGRRRGRGPTDPGPGTTG